MSRACAFLATSLDGFLAGPGDDLSWLPQPPPGEDFGFSSFLAGVGALLLGRRTYDVLCGLPPEAWAYGERPVLVATRRPLEPLRPTVRPVAGPLPELLAQARRAADGRDVYLDGGSLVRAALAEGLLERLTLTLVPVALGAGVPLFAGLPAPRRLELLGSRPLAGGLVQLELRPAGAPG